jgi:hypothetical protein
MADMALGITANVAGTTVSVLTNVEPPEYKVDENETTNHGNTNRFKTFEQGMVEAGEIKFNSLFDSTTYIALETLAATTSTSSVCTLTLPTSPSQTRMVMNGFIKALKLGSGKVGELMEGDFSWRISGKPTISKI